jgi:hypothetical protein
MSNGWVGRLPHFKPLNVYPKAEHEGVEAPEEDFDIGLDGLEEKPAKDTRPEGDRLKDFFFPRTKNTTGCQCGVDSTSVGGKHSPWCPKGG